VAKVNLDKASLYSEEGSIKKIKKKKKKTKLWTVPK
jgi:hypothetical protein